MAIVTAFGIAKQHYEAEIQQLTYDLEAARAENERLTEALRWYEHQRVFDYNSGVWVDNGLQAREALAAKA